MTKTEASAVWATSMGNGDQALRSQAPPRKASSCLPSSQMLWCWQLPYHLTSVPLNTPLFYAMGEVSVSEMLLLVHFRYREEAQAGQWTVFPMIGLSPESILIRILPGAPNTAPDTLLIFLALCSPDISTQCPFCTPVAQMWLTVLGKTLWDSQEFDESAQRSPNRVEN